MPINAPTNTTTADGIGIHGGAHRVPPNCGHWSTPRIHPGANGPETRPLLRYGRRDPSDSVASARGDVDGGASEEHPRQRDHHDNDAREQGQPGPGPADGEAEHPEAGEGEQPDRYGV